MWLLHQRNDHDREGAPRSQSQAVRSRGTRRTRCQSLPLRHPRTDHPCGAQGCRAVGEDLSMNLMMPTRREFTAGLGSIIVSFSLDPKLAFAQQAAKLPGSLAENGMLDAWIRINADGSATIFPGKVELGQGITTALTQIAAEELDLPLARVRVLTTDTRQSPNEGVTSGSQSIEYGGTAMRLASAEVRGILLDLAAKRLNAAADTLTVADGVIASPDGR